MSNVVLMLSSDIVLPQPKEPGFFTERDLSNDSSSTIKHETSSVNELTSTLRLDRHYGSRSQLSNFVPALVP
ncbi:hypothetical protein DKX38_025901 [Salix brachista]|uniref:S-locus receptor kinase C-terminal domain-containing protein n=1 Tax=Salix brachista TaxID=2182728 RepID=A0A5N5JR23_9ROSI|nr:hypothetical protein DKX38_025901 [Salix brachista]